MKEVLSATREGKPLALIEDNIKSLQRASAVIQKCFDVTSRALGLEKDDDISDEIPNLVFGELTSAQVSELKKMDEDNLVDDVEMLDAFDEDDEGDD